MREKADAIKASKMRIFVRRGGPNYQAGLALMRKMGDETGDAATAHMRARCFPSKGTALCMPSCHVHVCTILVQHCQACGSFPLSIDLHVLVQSAVTLLPWGHPTWMHIAVWMCHFVVVQAFQ